MPLAIALVAPPMRKLCDLIELHPGKTRLSTDFRTALNWKIDTNDLSLCTNSGPGTRPRCLAYKHKARTGHNLWPSLPSIVITLVFSVRSVFENRTYSLIFNIESFVIHSLLTPYYIPYQFILNNIGDKTYSYLKRTLYLSKKSTSLDRMCVRQHQYYHM